MPITAVSNIADLVTDYTIDPNAASGGTVLTSRRVDTTAPITGGGDLSANLNLALTTSPAGQTPVGTTRLISTTAPITGGGDLSANRTFAMAAHNGSVDGYVVKNAAGIQGKFYRDDGSWQSGTVAGVSSVIAGAGIAVSAATGDVTVSGLLVGIANQGEAPATGGADSTKFLCATNPVTWVVPGSGVFIKLQGSYPGTADVGNGHITGSFGAQTAIVAGSDKKSRNGGGNENLYVKQNTPSNPPVVASYYAGSQSPGFAFRSARGTEAVPTNTSTNDELVSLRVQPWQDVDYDDRQFLVVTQRASKFNHTPFDVDIYAQGSVTGQPYSYLHLGSNALSGVGTLAPLSGFEVATSLGLKTTLVNTNTAATDQQTAFIMDATAGTITLTLPTASGRSGRIVAIVRADSSANLCQISTTGGQTINGLAGVRKLTRAGESVILISDNSNWWSYAENGYNDRNSALNDVTVANTVAETVVTSSLVLAAGLVPGVGHVSRFLASGKLSTTGAPTLRFKLKNANAEVVADSGAVTMPSGVTDVAWMLEYVGVGRTASTVARVANANLRVAATAGLGAVMTQYNMMDVALSVVTQGAVVDVFTVQWGTASASNTITCREFLASVTPSTLVN